MKVAKARGRLRGKQPKLTPRQEAHLVATHRAGEHTSAELAELVNVARSTVYWALERARQTRRPPTPPRSNNHGCRTSSMARHDLDDAGLGQAMLRFRVHARLSHISALARGGPFRGE